VSLRRFEPARVNDQFSSEERLAALRGLIERKEVYALAFARTALVAGLLSILTAAAMFVNDEITPFLHRLVRSREFAIAWLVVFALTVLVGGMFLLRRARIPGDTSASVGMKVVLATIAPYLLIPAAFTAWFFATGYLGGTEVDLVVVWIAFYSLMLLSTTFFAPRSIVILGWAFLLTALAVPVIEDNLELWIGSVPTVLMGATFGLYHLIYAALNWRPKNARR
jgi:hypothetical protein